MLKNIKNDLVYLLNILEFIEKIYIYRRGCRSAEEFYRKGDQLNFNASLTLFTQIGENAVKISDELKKRFPFDWVKMKGFRNRIAHEYSGIDIYTVFEIIDNDLKNAKKEIIKIININLKKNVFDKNELLAAKKSYYYRHVDFLLFKVFFSKR